MPPRIFDVAWTALTYAGLERFLAEQTGEEPLHWEAKADGRSPLHGNSIRKAISGFANSHDGGYLIVGAAEVDDRWRIVGLRDPPRGELGGWLDRIVRSGVRPVPDYAVRVLRRRAPKVAIVAVDPVAEPPCITSGGSVYVRTAGSTVPVEDPAELARLYRRGDAARRSAEFRARRMAKLLFESPPVLPAGSVLLSVGMASTGEPPDRSSRLFTRRFKAALERLANQHRYGGQWQRGLPQTFVDQSSMMIAWHSLHDQGRLLIARWDGSVGVAFTVEDAETGAEYLEHSHWLKDAWSVGADMLRTLGESGNAHVVAWVRKRRWGAELESGLEPIEVRRWHSLLPPTDELLEGAWREIARAMGDESLEDEPL